MDFFDNVDVDIYPFVMPCSDEELTKLRFLKNWRDWDIEDLTMIGRLLDDGDAESSVTGDYYTGRAKELFANADKRKKVELLRAQVMDLYKEMFHIYFFLDGTGCSHIQAEAMRQFISARLLYIGTFIKHISEKKVSDEDMSRIGKDLMNRMKETFKVCDRAEDMIKKYSEEFKNAPVESREAFFLGYSAMSEIKKQMIAAGLTEQELEGFS